MRLIIIILTLIVSPHLLAQRSPKDDKRFNDEMIKAQNGDEKAQGNVAYCYKNIWGVAKNIPEAIKWAQLAADNGDAWGQTQLGYMYYDGSLPKDLIKAYAYSYLAYSNYYNAGDRDSARNCERNMKEIGSQMSSGQIKDAKVLAKELMIQIDAKYEASKKK